MMFSFTLLSYYFPGLTARQRTNSVNCNHIYMLDISCLVYARFLFLRGINNKDHDKFMTSYFFLSDLIVSCLRFILIYINFRNFLR